MIESLINKDYTYRPARLYGKSTARNVYVAWCKSALEEEDG